MIDSKQPISAPSSGMKKDGMGISKTVEIRVPPDALYRAVSTVDGLRGWWCSSIAKENGSEGILTLRFAKSGHVASISFAKGKAASRAEWDVLGHNAMPEWIGTKLVFDIEQEGPGGSRLRFQHVGLNPECECYDACNDAWGYLMGSVKAFLESGKGTPA
jgi:uncharacterized protein YndB with AHSA1/START domain